MKFGSTLFLVSLLLMMLSPAVLAAPFNNSEDQKLNIIPANAEDAEKITQEYEKRTSNSNRDEDGALTSDDILTKDTVLGVNMGNGQIEDLFDVSKWLGVISANAVIWAVICLVAALMGGLIFGGTILSLLKSALKIVIAICRNEDVDKAVGVVENEKRVSLKLIEGLGVIFGIMVVVIFLFNFIRG